MKIGDLLARVPVLQGGMGVGVSLANLAGGVYDRGNYEHYKALGADAVQIMEEFA